MEPVKIQLKVKMKQNKNKKKNIYINQIREVAAEESQSRVHEEFDRTAGT